MLLAWALLATVPVAAAYYAASLPDPPDTVVVQTPYAEWQRALLGQAKTYAAREQRLRSAQGVLEAGAAGVHVARPAKEAAERYSPDHSFFRQPSLSGTEFIGLETAPLYPPDIGSFVVGSSSGVDDEVDLNQVSLNRVVPNYEISASVVSVPGGVGYTVELGFSPRGIAALSDLAGPPTMTHAGYDWCRFWRQAGELVTQCEGVLVADNAAIGSFSIRDMLLGGQSTATLTLNSPLTASEAQSLADLLN